MNTNTKNAGLGRWIAVSLGLFVVSGSLILLLWMHVQGRKDSRRAFEILAGANARFVVDSNLPREERLASDLSEVLSMEVRFHREKTDVDALDAPGRESVQIELEGGGWMSFTRSAEGFWEQFWRRSMWAPLGLFWGLCLVLAWAVSRRVVKPLVELSERIPLIDSAPGEIPGLERRDEIGNLARTLAETQSNLADERAKREAAERLALLGKMATGLAHEIKNPLAAIQLHAQLLEGERGDSAGMIVAEGRRIEGLVNQWMFLARPEPPKVRRQDVRECLGEILDSVGGLAEHARVEVVREMPDGLIREIDGDRMGQVFRNLAMNAVHAMPGGGRLLVRVADDRVVFSDSGGGFSTEALDRWGELFFSTKEGGMGIGLSVAAEIVRAHGGELRVDNSAEGAVVEVIL
ncbi:MAG: ATP-binding protein [Verrucomicrobiales bacterium]